MNEIEREVEELKRRLERLERIMLKKHDVRPIRLRFDGDKDEIDIIHGVVCKIWNLPLGQLLGKCREAHMVQARKSGMLFCYDYHLGTTAEIGERFGDRDHSTVCKSIQSIRDQLESNDAELKDRYRKAKDILDTFFKQKFELTYQI